MTHTAVASPGRVSLESIRAHFPALERREGGVPVAYFDGPGGTQVASEVVDAMRAYLLHHNANTHWAYPTSEETDAIIEDARAVVADFLGGDADEIAFGANMTTLMFHIARALGRGMRSGDEIVVTELDHQANVAPWRAIASERGLTVRVARMIPETGTLDLDDLARQLDTRTRVVAVGAASNALGTITDVGRVVAMAHQVGALAIIDAVHLAPHALLDARAMDADVLACSAYKFYGPHLGLVWMRRSLMESMDVPKVGPAPDTAPERVETGTQNHEGIAGTAAAIEFLAALTGGAAARRARLAATFAELHTRASALTERLWSALSSIRGVRLFGPPPASPRTPTVAFALDGTPSEDVARALARRGVFASHGDFYASTVIERLGYARDGVVRAGCACYTTDEEVERLIAGVAEIAARPAGAS